MVVADTSILNILVLIHHQSILPQLFGEIVVPHAVLNELRHPSCPLEVITFLNSNPTWLKSTDLPSDKLAIGLDDGETAVITLALHHRANMVLLDDRKARRVAVEQGLRVMGTLGVLELASQKGFIDLPIACEALRKTNFRMRDELIRQVLTRQAMD